MWKDQYRATTVEVTIPSVLITEISGIICSKWGLIGKEDTLLDCSNMQNGHKWTLMFPKSTEKNMFL